MRDKLYRVSDNYTQATGAWQKGPRRPMNSDNADSDMAVKAGINSVGASHPATDKGTYARKPLLKPGRTRWNEN